MNTRADFWARRKAAVAAEAEADIKADAARAVAEEQSRLEEKSDAEILEELGLPDPQTLQPGDNIKAFMAEVVPDRLRRQALRQLWKLNPVLANLDQLVEYGEDYTDSACVVENMQTAYQVGKGMLAHVEELARQADATDASPADATCEESPQGLEEPHDMPVATATDPQDTPAPQTTATDVTEVDLAERAGDLAGDLPAPRRMRFEFESTE